MKIKDLPLGMVLIKEIGEIRVLGNEGRWGEELPGFYIRQPLVGFVLESYWKQLDIFQNINLDLHSEIVCKMVRIGGEPTKEDLAKLPEVKKWVDLQNESKHFYNTVEELNLLIGINQKKENQYIRASCLISKKTWKRVEYEQ